MAESTLITFAELEFLLRAAAGTNQASIDAVRTRLDLQPEAASDIVTAAGVASLLTRGLCTERGGDVIPGDQVLGIVAALATWHTMSEAAGWIEGQPAVVHLFSGPTARLVVSPGKLGIYSVEVVDPAESLAAPLTRFLDLCTAGQGEAAAVFRSSKDNEPEVGLAAARNADGDWLLSDTVDSPDEGRPSSRDAVTARLVALYGDNVVV
ncbi:hypothetical protein AB0K00_09660 [Dactylosporangium sp. NPDC049525]|uniref:hypothetical protein n=1 Tax=Dactylosporangium sp. NPDC049525 TaxID=3154730 RepID=UPI00342B6CF6